MALKKSEERANMKTSGIATAKKKMVLQYRGKEFDADAIIEKIREDIVTKNLINAEEITSLSSYVKPEENTVYYVVNDDIHGQINLW